MLCGKACMELVLSKEIADIRARYGLSLAQFGTLVGAPATSVKRWEAGVDPREQFFFQLYLVVGLIKDPDEVFYDLGRQGISLNKAQWDVFANLVKGADHSIDLAAEIGLDSPEVGQALVTGVRGLLTLIAGSFAAKNALGDKFSASLATRIATLLK
ncbi:hypothetical protein DSCO28_46260 [Desulfosarcina ovata subsp. sediminis]|uniref:Uncharacterized protein n=1 Tax=Desulfosarcina ovata subsp. sediminis TaxID=885957 RepID=A0A5K7ZV34_9BACT|nr:hypothetical protein DSCO28_46260 [Desulfosarcina ovata subsp. sediminis]